MPNHVNHHFAMSNLNDKQKEILKKIESHHHGMCGYYVPMPTELAETTSPPYVVSEKEYKRILKENAQKDPLVYTRKPITKKMQDAFIQKYGADNWYDWANDKWDTKWGCYDNDIDGETYTCNTAWSPMRQEIVELFALDFPNFTWHWEEEQGYGATYVYEDGQLVDYDDYDCVSLKPIGEYDEGEGFATALCYTKGRSASLSTEEVPQGFYRDYSFDEEDYLGETLPEDIFNLLDKDTKEKVLEIYNNL